MAQYDARLAHPLLLTLAARRAQARRRTQPKPVRTVVLTVLYCDARGEAPPEPGPTYVYTLPDKAP